MEESPAVSPKCEIIHFSVITGSLALFESDCRAALWQDQFQTQMFAKLESDPNVVNLTQSWTDLVTNMLLIACKCWIQIVWWDIKNVWIMLRDCLKCATTGHKTNLKWHHPKPNTTLFFAFCLMMCENPVPWHILLYLRSWLFWIEGRLHHQKRAHEVRIWGRKVGGTWVQISTWQPSISDLFE